MALASMNIKPKWNAREKRSKMPDQNQYVVTYSIMHTGTWFVLKLIDTCWWRYRRAVFGDIDVIPAIHGESLEACLETHGPLDAAWFDRFVVQFTPFAYRADNTRFHVNIHHQYPNAKGFTIRHRSMIPIVIPVRDPLLAWVSRVQRQTNWVEFQAMPPDQREEEFKVFLCLWDDLFAIDPKFVCFFRVDWPATPDTLDIRMEQAFRFFEWCHLPPPVMALDYVRKWAPVNTALGPSGAIKPWATPKEVQWVKDAAFKQDVATLAKVFHVEWPMLVAKHEWIGPLKCLGYSNLCWWPEFKPASATASVSPSDPPTIPADVSAQTK
jgi:hypothetical protein